MDSDEEDDDDEEDDEEDDELIQIKKSGKTKSMCPFQKDIQRNYINVVTSETAYLPKRAN